MSDWNLSPAEQKDWDAFVKHTRENTVQQMAESAYVVSIVPGNEPDIKFCVELGMSIMLDKPLLIVVAPGDRVPHRLREIADRIVECDIDTEDGRDKLLAALEEFRP